MDDKDMERVRRHAQEYFERFQKMQTEPEPTVLSNAGDRERREVIENLSEELTAARYTIERLQRELASSKWNESQAWKTAADMEAQRNNARSEIDELKSQLAAHEEWNARCPDCGRTHFTLLEDKRCVPCALSARITVLQRERDEARAALREAPHSENCSIWHDDENGISAEEEDCDCWKRAALGEG